MRVYKLMAAACLTFAMSNTAVSAQNYSGPAELPPGSYTASQYVDSRGCVYVRSGYDGTVRWVPRVTRARQQLCGAQPSALRRSAPVPVNLASAQAQGKVYIGPASAPRKIAEARSIRPPRGYKLSRSDARLNPRMGVGTLEGRAQMRRVWQDTVPRIPVERD